MYRCSLGLIFALFLAAALEAGAAEEVATAHLSGFDLGAGVSVETEPSIEPNGLTGPPRTEMGPILEPNG